MKPKDYAFIIVSGMIDPLTEGVITNVNKTTVWFRKNGYSRWKFYKKYFKKVSYEEIDKLDFFNPVAVEMIKKNKRSFYKMELSIND